MTAPAIEYLYDFGSPNAFIARPVLHQIAARHGAQVSYRPILLGGVFKAVGNAPPLMAFSDVRGKVDYIRIEFQRFIERHGIAFTWNKHFPVVSLMMMRGAIYAQGKGWEGIYIETCFDAMWQRSENMADRDVMHRVLTEAGLPADDILAATDDPEIKAALATATNAAIDRGVFGAPTMFLADEIFFGKDALNDLDWRLSRYANA